MRSGLNLYGLTPKWVRVPILEFRNWSFFQSVALGLGPLGLDPKWVQVRYLR